MRFSLNINVQTGPEPETLGDALARSALQLVPVVGHFVVHWISERRKAQAPAGAGASGFGGGDQAAE